MHSEKTITSSSCLELPKLWKHTNSVYNTVYNVGETLKSQFEEFTRAYRHLSRFYRRLTGRQPTELCDLEAVSRERKLDPFTVNIALDQVDLDCVDRLLDLAICLRTGHENLVREVVRPVITMQNHDPTLGRKFGQVVRCVHDAKVALAAIDSSPEIDDSNFTTDRNLPPHEKIWYLYCLVERETLAVSGLVESLSSRQRCRQLSSSPEPGCLPAVALCTGTLQAPLCRPGRLCQTGRPPHKIPGSQATDYDCPENWHLTLRNYKNGSSTNKKTTSVCSGPEISVTTSSLISLEPNDDVDSSCSLRVSKWNLREPPPATTRQLRLPCCNKTSLLRSKRVVSKPHGVARPLLAKISTGSMQAPSAVSETRAQVDIMTGRRQRSDRGCSEVAGPQIAAINEQLAHLQASIEQLVQDRPGLGPPSEQAHYRPLRHRAEPSLARLRELYGGLDDRRDDLEHRLSHANRLRIERGLFDRHSQAPH